MYHIFNNNINMLINILLLKNINYYSKYNSYDCIGIL